MNNKGNRKFRLACAITTLIISPLVYPDTQDWALEEVVVTARKKQENLQEVGASVSAMSQYEITHNFARDIRDLANASPNIIIDSTNQGPGGVAAIAIRGLGIADVEKSFDPAVGVVIDGYVSQYGVVRSAEIIRPGKAGSVAWSPGDSFWAQRDRGGHQCHSIEADG